MVPDDYHEFFLGAVTVAGALVGLLFVAISVRPGGVADGEDGDLTSRIRATSALVALLDALFLSLCALLPTDAIGGTAIGLGATGLITMVSLLVRAFAAARTAGSSERWPMVRMAGLVIGQGAVYVIQIVSGAHLEAGVGRNQHEFGVQAVVTLVLLGFGVVRAWEYVGGRPTGLLSLLDVARAVPHASGPSSEEASATRAESSEPPAAR